MRSDKQRQASRTNGAKSRGPKTPEGKNTSKWNGLDHGLCANQIVLPGESVEEFQAELKGWSDDWKPRSHTAAVFVERAAIGAWRLRRCVRAESDLLMATAQRIAERKLRADRVGHSDGDQDRLRRAEDRLDRDPVGTLAELRSSRAGLDRMIVLWDRLDEELADETWNSESHELLMNLLGHRGSVEAAGVGPLAVDSHRLSFANDSRFIADVLPGDEAEAIAARIQKGIAREVDALTDARRTLAEPVGEPDGSDVPDEELRFLGVTRQVMLLHRYEMAHERSMRAAFKDLLALEKVGMAGGQKEERETEVVAAQDVTETRPVASPRASVVSAPARSEPEAATALVSSDECGEGREGGPGRSERARRGRSPA
jgi:hypothetical protein